MKLYVIIVSSRVSVPPWNIDLTPFHLGQPKNSKSVRPPFYEHSPQNFGELESPPSNVPSSKKAKTHFLKKQNILFPTMK